jgi:hypothetical protein
MASQRHSAVRKIFSELDLIFPPSFRPVDFHSRFSFSRQQSIEICIFSDACSFLYEPSTINHLAVVANLTILIPLLKCPHD